MDTRGSKSAHYREALDHQGRSLGDTKLEMETLDCDGVNEVHANIELANVEDDAHGVVYWEWLGDGGWVKVEDFDFITVTKLDAGKYIVLSSEVRERHGRCVMERLGGRISIRSAQYVLLNPWHTDVKDGENYRSE